MKTAMPGHLIPTPAAAEFLLVAPSTIRMMGKRHKLTRHGSDRYGMWDLDELSDWMENHPDEYAGRAEKRGIVDVAC